ncbi:MAG: hypothetical protein CVT49_07620 [candidate division Zixibacteria bacterium HGW-Zixibacteria-1]|nr:MAG: hypothetical protein CVT49_07620 [candidate division Zixibacteria bacterium HGW-Zixibacteria-1]
MENDTKPYITPDSKVGALLEYFPELENVLMEMSPSFRKLRNPVLRRTVAKVATLRQVAKIGNISLSKMINELRTAAGQSTGDAFENDEITTDARPEWFNEGKVVKSFDARSTIEAGRNPMGEFFKVLGEVEGGKICELITPFVPAPLIELARGKGYRVWSRQTAEEKFGTYFIRNNIKEGDGNV